MYKHFKPLQGSEEELSLREKNEELTLAAGGLQVTWLNVFYDEISNTREKIPEKLFTL